MNEAVEEGGGKKEGGGEGGIRRGILGISGGIWTLHEEKGEERYLRRGTTQGREYL